MQRPMTRTNPLSQALRDKARNGFKGAVTNKVVASGEGWRISDIVCTCGPQDRPFEETNSETSMALVLSGSFSCRGRHGSALLAQGSVFLVEAGHAFECAHHHGTGDRCLAFQFDSGLFEEIVGAAGSGPARFGRHALPPLRALSPVAARACRALDGPAPYQEIAFDFALTVFGASRGTAGRSVDPQAAARIARTLREMESRCADPLPLAELAAIANLSPFHFLRTFKSVTGVTPHQWLLQARLRQAARALTTTQAPVTQVALDSGFDDLSNFVRSFRAEFGASPRAYRDAA